MPAISIDRVKRVLRKPPHILIGRAKQEIGVQWERFTAPGLSRGFNGKKLLTITGDATLEALWDRLGKRPYVCQLDQFSPGVLATLPAEEKTRILEAAEHALAHRVKLLGPNRIELGEQIDWLKDYKTNITWPLRFFHDIDYLNLDRPSDVKYPWEVSRLQWLIPAGQAWLLTKDEKYAAATKSILDDWIQKNPYAMGVNWACTMEVALRILVWTWFFHVFRLSPSWSDPGFRERFLCALFLHGRFTERHLEFSDVNGNHCTADGAGLVFAGLFFGAGLDPQRWSKNGWKLLQDELPKQVFEDGVDFESSVPYHRLVLELFLLPALYRLQQSHDVPSQYAGRLTAMARFAASYTRENGTVPLWGDADDARALPMGSQPINDHRYLPGLVGSIFRIPELISRFPIFHAEIFWLLGPKPAFDAAARKDAPLKKSESFPQGGFYVMRNEDDHVFIDCGPLGLKGRGGHGHNDILSFEACLQGTTLISDCGAFVYTGDYRERNRFRSTAYHNTPKIDGQEINRFVSEESMWVFHNDARHEVRSWHSDSNRTRFVGTHTGYERMKDPIRPLRAIELNHAGHILCIRDRFEGVGIHDFEIPFHFAAGINVIGQSSQFFKLQAGDRIFCLAWQGIGEWKVAVEKARISPSYGVAEPSFKLIWNCHGGVEVELLVGIGGEKVTESQLKRQIEEMRSGKN